MPYTFDDFLATSPSSNELFSGEVADMRSITIADAKAMFPGTPIKESSNLAWFPFKLCHSLPTVNLRGRCFTAPVLQRSFASLNNQLVNLDHQLEANFPGSDDLVVGAVNAVLFNAGEVASATELADIPSQPMPVVGLGSIFRRTRRGQKIVEQGEKGEVKWCVSMECGHNWSQAHFLYEGKFIPVTEADPEMLACIKTDHVLPYKNKKLAVALGGLNGSVDFWGLGLTLTPAEATADVMGFVTGQSRDLASRKIFYMPLESFSAKSLEVANKLVDEKVKELAAITVIGETQPDTDDQHKHQILSNLSVLPHKGHQHRLTDFSISRGTKPTLTGVTSEHYHRVESGTGSHEHVHSHMVNVPLVGKFTGAASTDVTDTGGVTGAGTVVPPPANADLANLILSSSTLLPSGDARMTRPLADITGELNKKIAGLLICTVEGDRNSLSREIASLNTELASVTREGEVKASNEAYVAKLITDKKLVTREQANTEIEAAEKKKEAEAKDRERIALLKTARLDKIREASINPEAPIPGVNGADGKPLTVAGYVTDLPFDDSGERAFTISFQGWKAQAAQDKALADAEAAKLAAGTTPTAAAQVAAPAAEAASAGKTSFFLAHAGKTTSETANAGAPGTPGTPSGTGAHGTPGDAGVQPPSAIDGAGNTARMRKGAAIFTD